MSFIHDFGVPKTLVTDGTSEMQMGRGQTMANVDLKVTVPCSLQQNKAESRVGEPKRFTRRKIQQTKMPRRLWPYVGMWEAAIRRLSALNIPELDGGTPHEHITGLCGIFAVT